MGCNHRLLNLDQQARSNLLHQIMDTFPIKDIIMSRILNFFTRGLNHESSTISDFLKNTIPSHSSYMLTNINTILNKYDLKCHDLFSLSKTHIKNVIQTYNGEHDWRSSLVKCLLRMRDKHCDSVLYHTEVKQILK